MEHTAIAGQPILLYDGVCGFCNRIVQLLLRLDRAGVLRFAPLESPLSHELLATFSITPTDPAGIILVTAALTPQMAVYRRSDATAEALRQIGYPWHMLATLLRIVPYSLREWGYGLVAHNRYRLFGKFETCPIPTEAQHSRILGM